MTAIKYLEKLLNLALLFYFIFEIFFVETKKNLLGFILFCIYHFIPKINIIESFFVYFHLIKC